MKLNILGTTYQVIKDNEHNNPKLNGSNGYCEPYSKKIVLEEGYEESPKNVENFEEFKKKVFRHEIIHAFFIESGLHECCDWATDEMVVDWIAKQLPKMYETMKEAKCI